MGLKTYSTCSMNSVTSGEMTTVFKLAYNVAVVWASEQWNMRHVSNVDRVGEAFKRVRAVLHNHKDPTAKD